MAKGEDGHNEGVHTKSNMLIKFGSIITVYACGNEAKKATHSGTHLLYRTGAYELALTGAKTKYFVDSPRNSGV